MSEGAHDLISEFPKHKERIRTLKLEDSHFRKLFDQYHDVTRQISRSEQRIELLTSLEEENLRKKRLVLKDEIYQIITSKDA